MAAWLFQTSAAAVLGGRGVLPSDGRYGTVPAQPTRHRGDGPFRAGIGPRDHGRAQGGHRHHPSGWRLLLLGAERGVEPQRRADARLGGDDVPFLQGAARWTFAMV